MAKKPSPEKPAPSSLLPGFQHLIPDAAAAPLAAHIRPLFLPDLVQQIVCNYAEIRLYSRQRSSNHVHRVLLTELDDPDRFAEFYAIFHADSLLGTGMFAQNIGWLLREGADKRDVFNCRGKMTSLRRRRFAWIVQLPKGIAKVPFRRQQIRTRIEPENQKPSLTPGPQV
jgi:hypothetical protein